MKDWNTIDLLTPEDQERARKLFTPADLPKIGDYEFSYFGPKLLYRIRPELRKDRLEPEAKPAAKPTRGKVAAKPPAAEPPALADVTASEAGESNMIVHLALAVLRDSPTQPRQTYAAPRMDELTDSVKQVGIIQPLLVRRLTPPVDGFEFELVFGHRRKRAAERAGLATAPAMIRVLSDEEVVELQLIENLQRHDLDPIDEALGLAQALALRADGDVPRYTRESLAVKLGKSAQHVGDRLRLLRLPREAQTAMQRGEMGESIGYLVAKVPSAELRKQLTKEVLKGHGEGVMSASEVRAHIRRSYMVELRGSPFDQRDATLVPAREKDGERCFGGACTDCPFNSANMPESAEQKFALCTLPTCYGAKLAEAVAAVKTAALAAGAIVIEGERGKRLIYHDGTPNYDTGMVNLALAPAASEVVGQKKAPTWKKMLAGKVTVEVVEGREKDGTAIKGKVSHAMEVRPTVVIDAKGKAHWLVERKVAIEAAKKNGYADLFTAKASRSKAAPHSDQQARDELDRAKKKLESAQAVACAEALSAEIAKRGMHEDAWIALLDVALFHSATDAQAFLCLRRQLEVPKTKGEPDREKAIRQHADTLTAERMPALVVELLLAGWMKSSGADAPGFVSMAKAFDLDVKAIKTRVIAAGAEAKKPKVKTKVEPPAKTVRELIGELCHKRKMTLLQVNQVAQVAIGKNYEFAQGTELTLILHAIKELPIPQQKPKSKPVGKRVSNKKGAAK